MFGRDILNVTILEGGRISPIIKKINHNYKKNTNNYKVNNKNTNNYKVNYSHIIMKLWNYEIRVNMNHEWIRIIDEYDLWVNMNYGGIGILGESELWMNMN